MKNVFFLMFAVIPGLLLSGCGKKAPVAGRIEFAGPKQMTVHFNGREFKGEKIALRTAPGSYNFRFSAPGYYPCFSKVSVKAGQTNKVKVDLAPVSSAVLIDSVPQGAKVKFQGEIRGATPLVISRLPAGKYYSSKAQKGEPEYLSSTLIASLFGGGSYPKVAEDWIEVALYLSVGNHPCEFAVILCQNRDAAHDTAKLFCSRLSAIKITKNSAEYENMITNAKVAVSGNFALLIISSDPENALKIIQKKIGKY